MIKISPLLIVILFWSARGICEIPQQKKMNQGVTEFQSTTFDFDLNKENAARSPGSYPQWLIKFYNWIGWSPLNISNSYAEEAGDCSFEVLREKTAKSVVAIQEFIDHCGQKYANEKNPAWRHGIKALSLQYDPVSHPNMFPLKIHLPDGEQLHALLAYRGSEVARPMVILRLGVFASSQDFQAEKYLLWQLFDESHFNVLVVENTVSADYINSNSRLILGGFDEGLQNYWLAKKLQDPAEPISKIISSVSLVGVSLGGHGVLFASELNKINPKTISSFIGLCPVIDLEYNFKNLVQNNTKNFLMDYWAAFRLQGLKKKSNLFDEVGFFSKLFPYYLKSSVDVVVENYKKPSKLLEQIQIPKKLKDENGFWQLNRFWPQTEHDQVLVIANPSDDLVPFDKNIGDNTNGSGLSKVIFPEGYHCTTHIAYRWNLTGELLRGYILTQSAAEDITNSEFIQIQREGLIPPNMVSNYRNNLNPHYEVMWGLYQNPILFFANGLQIDLKLEDIDFKAPSGKLTKEEKLARERWIRSQVNFSVVDRVNKSYLVATFKKVDKKLKTKN